ERDRHPAEVIRREVIGRHHHALVIYGGGHLWRSVGAASAQPDEQFLTLVQLLERSGLRVVTLKRGTADLAALQPDAASWSVPSLVRLRGTSLGLAKFRFYVPAPPPLRERDPLRDLLMQDQWDALLYEGPPAPIAVSHPLLSLCRDEGYMQMR